MKYGIPYTMLIYALMSILSSPVFAGTVVLQSGARVEGKVIRRQNSVRVENADGTYTFNLDRVKTIEGNRPARTIRRRPGPQPRQEVAQSRTEEKTYRYVGRTSGPRKDVERVHIFVPVRFGPSGDHYMSVGRTDSYVRAWDTRGDRDEPVVGTIGSRTTVGTGGGGIRFMHTGRPRFRTFRWETDEGERRIHLPSQTSIRVETRE